MEAKRLNPVFDNLSNPSIILDHVQGLTKDKQDY
jgi:hypothetical protein